MCAVGELSKQERSHSQGYETEFLRLKKEGEKVFEVDQRLCTFYCVQHSHLASPLSALVTRLLPLCGHYVFITDFVLEFSQYGCGVVSHAVCVAIEELLKVIVWRLWSTF